MNIIQLLSKAVELQASDVHLTSASPPIFRINGNLVQANDKKLHPEDTSKIIESIMKPDQIKLFNQKGELDFSYAYPGLGRFRINAYKQRGSYSMAIRIVTFKVPTIEELGLPPVITELSKKRRGLILVTGPTGSGKSTTLAAMINHMNHYRNDHILTLEDPIEYLHKHKNSMVNQREIGNDSASFGNALRSALRQDPDVILVGEMRDLETISTAITAAETGHLVLSTLHTIGASKTIDRIIDAFPPHQQDQIKVQLSTVLEGVISQQLLPKYNQAGRIAAFEIMVANPAISNLIREGKTHQIQTIIQTGAKFGMQTMDASLIDLYRRQIINQETLLKYAIDLDMIERQMGINY